MTEQQKMALRSLCRDVQRAIRNNEEQYAPGVLADFREQFKRGSGARAKTQCCVRWLKIYRGGE